MRARFLISAILGSIVFNSISSIEAAPPGDFLFGENPARKELIPSPDLLESRVLGVGDAYRLRIIYMIPSNRSPQPAAEEKLQEYVLRKQKWFSDHMALLGFAPKTFQYEVEADGLTPKVNLVYVAEPDTDFHGEYLEIWSNVLNGIADAGYPPWQRGELMLVVAEIHVQNPDGSFLESSVFFGGAGTNFSGVGMVTGETLARLSEAFLTDDRLYDGLVIPEMGPYPLVQSVSFPWFEGSTLSSTSSSAQGGALHELGHGLGLWHDFRNDSNSNGNLMGNGLRGIRGAIFPNLYPDDDTRLANGSALQLNYNRFFNPEQTYIDNTPPQVQLLSQGTVVPENGLCRLNFTASDVDSALGGAILARAGDVVAEMPLAGSQLASTIATYDYEPGVEDEWALLVFDTQGNRALSRASITCAEGFNRAPQPYVEVSKSNIEVGEEVILDAGRSFDPDGDSSRLMVEWDLDGNGTFDTRPSTTRTHSAIYETDGIYQIIARLTDEQGDSSLSMPIGIKVEPPASPLPKSVVIKIKPGDKQNTINPSAKGSIWVAILSDTDAETPFDPSAQVDIPTVEFGPDLATAIHHKVEDINQDGLGDLLLRFKILETGIACGDTEATLSGETFEGLQFVGTDSVRTVGCKPMKCDKKKHHNKHHHYTHHWMHHGKYLDDDKKHHSKNKEKGHHKRHYSKHHDDDRDDDHQKR